MLVDGIKVSTVVILVILRTLFPLCRSGHRQHLQRGRAACRQGGLQVHRHFQLRIRSGEGSSQGIALDRHHNDHPNPPTRSLVMVAMHSLNLCLCVRVCVCVCVCS
ncbi:hypothetical protein SKAU_G00345600 [Synaphobranchus kaupii]|uniref:Uncharacterized protein n=1 Tax=Synaphobranchus kaupii TaxID=118154 RepID=A0A9Q1EJG2_SYNKA|nr:hypothetical protein SKAU_G00345600 [Synaphobranchus kaupii]